MTVSNVLVILSGGSGVRFGADMPKQYVKINGKELIYYSLDEMAKSKKKDAIILVLNDDPERIKKIEESYNIDVIIGGEDRAHSFQNALDYIEKTYSGCKNVVFHEAARPMITHDVVDEYFDLLEEYDYVETCKKISDSLGSYVVDAPRREDYYLIQAPEAYRLSVLKQHYDCNSTIYYAGNQFPSFIKGYQYFGISNNIKLTTPNDKVLIEYILKNK